MQDGIEALATHIWLSEVFHVPIRMDTEIRKGLIGFLFQAQFDGEIGQNGNYDRFRVTGFLRYLLKVKALWYYVRGKYAYLNHVDIVKIRSWSNCDEGNNHTKALTFFDANNSEL